MYKKFDNLNFFKLFFIIIDLILRKFCGFWDKNFIYGIYFGEGIESDYIMDVVNEVVICFYFCFLYDDVRYIGSSRGFNFCFICICIYKSIL